MVETGRSTVPTKDFWISRDQAGGLRVDGRQAQQDGNGAEPS